MKPWTGWSGCSALRCSLLASVFRVRQATAIVMCLGTQAGGVRGV